MSKYILNSSTQVYHAKDCYCIEFIDRKNIIKSNSINKNYRPCSKCLKEDYDNYIKYTYNNIM